MKLYLQVDQEIDQEVQGQIYPTIINPMIIVVRDLVDQEVTQSLPVVQITIVINLYNNNT